MIDLFKGIFRITSYIFGKREKKKKEIDNYKEKESTNVCVNCFYPLFCIYFGQTLVRKFVVQTTS